ncbi:hypothetical protein EO087_14235 [Dyella sp. M7H15-1]|nr:hypothetical protein EO087_14235 [Dyella sp. M7H15-1]
MPPSIDDAGLVSSKIEQRLMALRQEYETGQAQLRALEQRTRELKDTLQRISGAIAVLEELAADGKLGAV